MKNLQSLKFYYDLAQKDVAIDTKLSLEEVEKSYNNLQTFLKNNKNPVYGVHTGYGSNVNELKNFLDFENDQIELLNYLRVGTGPLLDESIVRRALRIQALKIAKGYSGTSPQIYLKLWELASLENLPKVPIYGSLGASGDLIPMAHAVYPIFKDGVYGPRDVISLVNTNAMMASYAVELITNIKLLVEKSFEFVAQVTIAMKANMEHFDEEGFKMNPQKETIAACKKINHLRNNILQKFDSNVNLKSTTVQEKYSLRCLPQVYGQILRNLEYCENLIIDEANQLSDNPIILDENKVWHGGHFYAIGIATSSDLLQDVCLRINEFIDRIVLNLMDSNLSNGLPTNLKIAQNDHLKGIHQLISSLLQRAKGLHFPSALMSFSCEGNNQDIVPCSMNALNQLSDLTQICDHIIRAASFCSERAMLLRMEQQIPSRLELSSWE